MLTVSEAAARAGRNPETIRRWIRSGRLRARNLGAQHVIQEDDLAHLLEEGTLPRPREWNRTITGEPMPDVVAELRRQRLSH